MSFNIVNQYLTLSQPLFSFDRISCIPDWSRSCYVAEDNAEVLIALLLLPKCWDYDYRCVPPYSSYAVGSKLRVFCTVSKQNIEPYLLPLILLFLFTEISLVYTVACFSFI